MHLLKKLTSFSSSRRGVWVVIIVWALLAGLMTAVASPAKEFAVNVRGSSVQETTESMIAQKLLDDHFSQQDGLMALLVFNHEKGMTDQDLLEIGHISEWLSSEEKPEIVKELPPFHVFPAKVQLEFSSEDRTTLVLPVLFQENQEMAVINDTVNQIEREAGELLSGGMDLYITGPAGIASDTIAIFANADLILLFSTITLVLILLIIIYRSPLLAIIPLVVVGIVHQVVDGTLGIAGEYGWFSIETQSHTP